jgi:hypothetical protein
LRQPQSAIGWAQRGPCIFRVASRKDPVSHFVHGEERYVWNLGMSNGFDIPPTRTFSRTSRALDSLVKALVPGCSVQFRKNGEKVAFIRRYFPIPRRISGTMAPF